MILLIPIYTAISLVYFNCSTKGLYQNHRTTHKDFIKSILQNPNIFKNAKSLIPFAFKWHAGLILDKNNTFNINYCFLTTIYEMEIRTHSEGAG